MPAMVPAKALEYHPERSSWEAARIIPPDDVRPLTAGVLSPTRRTVMVYPAKVTEIKRLSAHAAVDVVVVRRPAAATGR